jgi:hypothetical protein
MAFVRAAPHAPGLQAGPPQALKSRTRRIQWIEGSPIASDLLEDLLGIQG